MKAVGVLLLLCVLAGCGVSVWAEAADSTAVAQADAAVAVETVTDSEVEAEAAAEVEAAAEAETESDSEAEADIEAEAEAEADSEAEVEAEGELQSQAELDAAHENAVATLEQYAEKAHALRDEIITSEHSLMEQMAAIDSCPPSQLKGLMARAKKQITHLFQIKALYLAIKQQEKQLRALLNAGTGKRAPNVAPKTPAPLAPKPSAAKAVSVSSSAAVSASDAAGLAAMNAKLVNALARLEGVTARLAVVERRQGKGKTATLVIAAQMEKDEKRLNKHSRVLRRLRSRQHKIRSALKRLAKSCKRGKSADRRVTRKSRRSRRGSRRGGRRGGKPRKAIAKARSARKAKKPAAKKGKKAAAKKTGKRVTKKAKKAFNLNACFARCAKRSERRQSHCVRACRRRAALSARRRRGGKRGGKKARRSRKGRRGSRKGRRGVRKGRRGSRKGRRSPALKRCLAKCRKAFTPAKRAVGMKCAVTCFRRHMHRKPRGSRRGRGVRRSRKGKGKGKGKKSFNLKQCLAKCPRSKKNAKRRSRKCTRSCYRAARAARGKKRRASNPALKKCFKTCRKGKKWNRKCVKSCRAKHAKKGKKRGAKKWSAKKLKACYKTCRGKSRVVTRRNKKTGKSRRIRVKGKWNMPCVKSCRKRFGKPRARKGKGKKNPALKKCYKTCKGKKVNGKRQWNMACVRRCRTRYGRKARKAPRTAAYKACLKRCRPGKSYRKCRKACAKHNRVSRLPRIRSPSRKAVAAAMKGLKKTKKAKKSRPETWEDVVRQSRRLLKKTVRLRDLVHKQVARHFDTKDVEGRKYNGWWSIYDVLKGVKPGKHYTSRAKEINADVRQIMQPALAKAADGPYGEVVNVLKGADEAFSSKYTRELGSPALDLTVDPKFEGYVEKPLPGARIKHVPYNPKKPYDPSQHTWRKTPPLSRLPEMRDEDYDENLAPIYARQFKITPRKAPAPAQPFELRRKNWDYPQIPYSYPVTMVSHDPKYKNPHVRAPTPGFHADWPEFRFQQTATSADATAASAAAAPAAPAAPAAAAPAPASQQPMTEGTNDA